MRAQAQGDTPAELLRGAMADAREAIDSFLAADANAQTFGRVAEMMTAVFAGGGKVLAVGNGGSACDAMHFCEELTGRFRAAPAGQAERRPLPAIACSDPGHITCTANDFGYERVFARWVEALGREGDVLVAMSTSGNSANVVEAVRAAGGRGMTTVGLLGKDGGALAGMCDHAWVVPGQTADRIQEVHMVVLHTLIEAVEALLPEADARHR